MSYDGVQSALHWYLTVITSFVIVKSGGRRCFVYIIFSSMKFDIIFHSKYYIMEVGYLQLRIICHIKKLVFNALHLL